MIHLHDIRYVRLGTPDLDGAVRYATEILGLQVARREGKAVYFKSDSRDHTLCYFEGDPRDHTTGFEVDTPEELEQALEQLERAGYQATRGKAAEAEQRYVREFINFKDPSGNSVDLVYAPLHSGRRYFPSRDAGITGFSHIGLRTLDARRDEVFWTRLLSAKVSDRIGEAPLLRIDEAPLLRIDEVHHKIALFPSAYPGVQHINHQVESIDDIMRAFYVLQEKGIPIRFGPGRHPTSSAIFLYFEGPDGMIYEYSTGVRLITEEDEKNYRPRNFPADPTGFCMWGSKPDIPEFKS
ncbi:glyoxalase/bleomycin resistance/extradiol dioxygenase family protein [Pigmentiphaga sp. NML080357]|uniref:VOC family protein n=1 Tax=Pigmentiphaga sp. NML080357 TaxID=2008675 RepID=UPI000B407147|nr:VOC family protein [Pigmentiphaga sp. NML080357]OVZ56390.1 glyoxalase/bleomycin resistance/extradiol dioxygenase family protein [Pigmentiphaga sp. NML080357]